MSALRHLVTRLWAWWTQPRAHAQIEHDWHLLEVGWRAAQHAADAQQERARRREQAQRALRYRQAQRTLATLRREVDLLQRRQHHRE